MKSKSKLDNYAYHKMLVDAMQADGVVCDAIAKEYDEKATEQGGVGFRKIFHDINTTITHYHKLLRILTGEWRADITETIPVIDFLHTENTSIMKYYDDTSKTTIRDIPTDPSKTSLDYIEANDPHIINRAIAGDIVAEQFYNNASSISSNFNVLSCAPAEAIECLYYKGSKLPYYTNSLSDIDLEESIRDISATDLIYYEHTQESPIDIYFEFDSTEEYISNSNLVFIKEQNCSEESVYGYQARFIEKDTGENAKYYITLQGIGINSVTSDNMMYDTIFVVPKTTYSAEPNKVIICKRNAVTTTEFSSTVPPYSCYLLYVANISLPSQATSITANSILPEKFNAVKDALSEILEVPIIYRAPASGLLNGAFCDAIEFTEDDTIVNSSRNVTAWEFKYNRGYKYYPGHLLYRGEFLEAPLALKYPADEQIFNDHKDWFIEDFKDYPGKLTFLWDYLANAVKNPLDNYVKPYSEWKNSFINRLSLDTVLTKFDYGASTIDSIQAERLLGDDWKSSLTQISGENAYKSQKNLPYPEKWKISSENADRDDYKLFADYFSLLSNGSQLSNESSSLFTPLGDGTYCLNILSSDPRVATFVKKRMAKEVNYDKDRSDIDPIALRGISTDNVDKIFKQDPLKFIKLQYAISFQVSNPDKPWGWFTGIFKNDTSFNRNTFRNWFYDEYNDRRNAANVQILSPIEIFRPKNSSANTILLYPEYRDTFPHEVYLISKNKLDLVGESKTTVDGKDIITPGSLCTFYYTSSNGTEDSLISFRVEKEISFLPSKIRKIKVIDNFQYETYELPADVLNDTGISRSCEFSCDGFEGKDCYIYILKDISLTSSEVEFVDHEGNLIKTLPTANMTEYNDWSISPLSYSKDNKYFIAGRSGNTRSLAADSVAVSVNRLENSSIISNLPSLPAIYEVEAEDGSIQTTTVSLEDFKNHPIKDSSLRLLGNFLDPKVEGSLANTIMRVNSKVISNFIKNFPVTTDPDNPATVQDIPLMLEGIKELINTIGPLNEDGNFVSEDQANRSTLLPYMTNLIRRFTREDICKRTVWDILCNSIIIEGEGDNVVVSLVAGSKLANILNNNKPAEGETDYRKYLNDAFNDTLDTVFSNTNVISIEHKEAIEYKKASIISLIEKLKAIDISESEPLSREKCISLDNLFGNNTLPILNLEGDSSNPNLPVNHMDFYNNLLRYSLAVISVVDTELKKNVENLVQTNDVVATINQVIVEDEGPTSYELSSNNKLDDIKQVINNVIVSGETSDYKKDVDTYKAIITSNLDAYKEDATIKNAIESLDTFITTNFIPSVTIASGSYVTKRSSFEYIDYLGEPELIVNLTNFSFTSKDWADAAQTAINLNRFLLGSIYNNKKGVDILEELGISNITDKLGYLVGSEAPKHLSRTQLSHRNAIFNTLKLILKAKGDALQKKLSSENTRYKRSIRSILINNGYDEEANNKRISIKIVDPNTGEGGALEIITEVPSVGVDWFSSSRSTPTYPDVAQYEELALKTYKKIEKSIMDWAKITAEGKNITLEPIGIENLYKTLIKNEDSPVSWYSTSWLNSSDKNVDNGGHPYGTLSLVLQKLSYSDDFLNLKVGKDELGNFTDDKVYQDVADLDQNLLEKYVENIKRSLDGISNLDGADPYPVSYSPNNGSLKGNPSSLYYKRYSVLNNRLNKSKGTASTLGLLSSNVNSILPPTTNDASNYSDTLDVTPLEDMESLTYLPTQAADSSTGRLAIQGKFYSTEMLDAIRKAVGDKCALTCTRCGVKSMCPFYNEEDIIKMYCPSVNYIDVYVKDNKLDLLVMDDTSPKLQSEDGEILTYTSEEFKDIHKIYSNILKATTISEDNTDPTVNTVTDTSGKEKSLDELQRKLISTFNKGDQPDKYHSNVDTLGWMTGGRYGTVEVNPVYNTQNSNDVIDVSDAQPYKYMYDTVFIPDEQTYVNYSPSTTSYEVSVDLTKNGSRKHYTGSTKLHIPTGLKMIDSLGDNDELYLVSDDVKDSLGNKIVPVIYLGTKKHVQDLIIFDIVENDSASNASAYSATITAGKVAQWCINYLKGNCIEKPVGSHNGDIYSDRDQYWMETLYNYEEDVDGIKKWVKYPGRERRSAGYQEPTMTQSSSNQTLVVSGKPVMADYNNFVRKMSIKMFTPANDATLDGEWNIEWASPYSLKNLTDIEKEAVKEQRRMTLPHMKTNLRLVAVKRTDEF